MDAISDTESIRILGLVRRRPCITGRQIAERTGIPVRTVWRRLASMQRRGLLSNAMGPRQRPEWKVTKAGYAALTIVTRAKPQVIDVSGATLALVENGSEPGRVQNLWVPRIGFIPMEEAQRIEQHENALVEEARAAGHRPAAVPSFNPDAAPKTVNVRYRDDPEVAGA